MVVDTMFSRRLGKPSCAPPDIITYLQQGVKHTRSGTGRRPWRAGIETGGIIGSTTSHSSSRTSNTVATQATSTVAVMSLPLGSRATPQIVCATSS
jgi:hypothetical protein